MKTFLKNAFTLAEVLITFTIIGIIVAVSLPALIVSIDDTKYTSARERAVYNMREAVRSLSSNNGGIGGLGTSIQFRDALAKYLSVSKTCDTVTDCFQTTIKDITGINDVIVPIATMPNLGQGHTAVSNAAGMVLNNGTTMSISYNSLCSENTTVLDNNDRFAQNHVCANIVFDTNGNANPNQVGKDIGFVTVINPTNIVVTGIIPSSANSANADWFGAQSSCSATDTKGIWHLPTKDELNSLFYNKAIIGSTLPTDWYVSSTENASDHTRAWLQNMGDGSQDYFSKVGGRAVCS